MDIDIKNLYKIMRQQASPRHLRKKKSIVKHLFNPHEQPSNKTRLPSLNVKNLNQKKYKTIDHEPKPQRKINLMLPQSYMKNRIYTKQDIEQIRKGAQENIINYKNKYKKPNGAALCPRLAMIVNRKNFQRENRKRSQSTLIGSIYKEKIDKMDNNQISACTYEQSLFYG